MNSSVTLRLEYDWKGETLIYQSEVVLPLYIADLNEYLATLPAQLARLNQLETNSPQFDWMAANPIMVVAFKSRIANELPSLPLEVSAFLTAYKKQGTQAYLKKIAESFDLDIEANPKLVKALKAAYTLGKEHRLLSEKKGLYGWTPRGFT
jgi:hypothetical protein